MHRHISKRAVYLLLLAVLFVAMVPLHMDTYRAHNAVRDIANKVLAQLFLGTLHIGVVNQIDLDGTLVASDISLRDPRGRLVISGGVLHGGPVSDLLRGLRRRGPMPQATLTVEQVVLLPGVVPEIPSIADSFEFRHPSPSSTAITPPPNDRFHFPLLSVQVHHVHSELVGIVADATQALAHGEIMTDPTSLSVRGVNARATSSRTPEVAITGEIDLRDGFVAARGETPARYTHFLEVGAAVVGPGIDCHLRYRRTDEDERFTATNCSAARKVVNWVVQQRLDVDLNVATFEAVRSPRGLWRIQSQGTIDEQPFVGRVRVDGTDLVGDLTVTDLDLERLRDDLPRSRITGAVHVERHGPRWLVDTEQLHATVAGVIVPPAHANGHLVGDTLIIDELRSGAAGVVAHGSVDLGTPNQDAIIDAHVDTPDASRLPFLVDRFHGPVVADIHLERRHGDVHARYTVHARDLRSPVFRAGDAQITGTLAVNSHGPHIDAEVEGNRVTTNQVGPVHVRAHVTGDPTSLLEGTVHLDGARLVPQVGPEASGSTGPTRVDAHVTARISRDSVRLNIGNSPLVIRGATGTVRGSVVIPLGEGQVAANAHIESEHGGSAEVDVHGSDVSGAFHGFSLDWLSRALGMRSPLVGNLEGNLDLLTNRASRAHGTVRWINGHAPLLGDFNAVLTADHRGAVSSFTAEVTYGPLRNAPPSPARPMIRAEMHGIPPRNIADAAGWIRGIRDANIDLVHAPMAVLDEVLPRVAHIEGTTDAHVELIRTGPDEELNFVLGVDSRNAQISGSVTRYLPTSLQGLVHASVSTAAITQPVRMRGAFCGRLPHDELRIIPLTVNATIAVESGEPIVALPSACTNEATAIRRPLVHIGGDLDGPWYSSILSALTEYRTAGSVSLEHLADITLSHLTRQQLAASHMNLVAEIGPVTRDNWPFTATAASLMPSLLRPRADTSASFRVSGAGSLISPQLEVRADMLLSGLEQLVTHDQVHVSGHVNLAALVAGESIFGPVRLTAEMNAALLAATATGTQPAGTAQGELDARTSGSDLFDPEQGLRNATFDHFFVHTSRIQLGRLRWSRANSMMGRVELTMRETGDQMTPIAVNATITEFRVRTARTMGASVNAFIRNNGERWEVQACGTMLEATTAPGMCDPDGTIDTAPERGLVMGSTLPLNGNGLDIRPDFTSVRLALASRDFPLETVSPALEISPIVRVGGQLTSHIDWSALAARSIRGEVHVRNGLLDMERVGLPAHQIELDITADGRTADISHLAFHLGTGTAEGRGSLDFHASGNDVAGITLHASTNQLPATQEGNLYGYINSVLNYTGMFRTNGHSGTLSIPRASIAVPNQSSRDLQDLGAHGDVFVIGETRISSATAGHAYPIDIDFSTDAPVWVRRNDFEIAIETRGHIHYDPAGVALRGQISQASPQSWVDLFGKRFYFERIGMDFDGSIVYNPSLDVAARFNSPQVGNINLFVSGRYLAPEIRFTSEQNPSMTQSEVIALLMIGQSQNASPAGSQSAVEQGAIQAAQQLLSGVIGMGTMFAQQQINARSLPFIPRIILEPTVIANADYRYGFGGTFSALPRLYIETTYGTFSPYGSAVSADTSAQRPSDFHGMADYTLSPHWSVSANVGSSGRAGTDLWYNFSP